MSDEVYETKIKNPDETDTFSFDWTNVIPIGDTINVSLWVLPSDTVDGIGITEININTTIIPDYTGTPSPQYSLGGTNISGLLTSIRLKGGTLDKKIIVENRVTTVAGLKYVKRFILWMCK